MWQFDQMTQCLQTDTIQLPLQLTMREHLLLFLRDSYLKSTINNIVTYLLFGR